MHVCSALQEEQEQEKAGMEDDDSTCSSPRGCTECICLHVCKDEHTGAKHAGKQEYVCRGAERSSAGL